MYVYFIDYEVQCSTRMRPHNCDVYILLQKNSNLTLKYLVLFIFIGHCCGQSPLRALRIDPTLGLVYLRPLYFFSEGMIRDR